MNLSDFLQNQESRVGALERSDSDENLLIPKISKFYEGVRVVSKVAVTKAEYYTCGLLMCSENQRNTTRYSKTYY